MQKGQVDSRQQLSVATFGLGLGVLLCVLSGCATSKSHLDQEVRADHGGPVRNEGVVAQYRLSCPDVLEVNVMGQPDLLVRGPIGPDGRFDLPGHGRLRIEGQTVEEAAQTFAAVDDVPVSVVQVHVLQYRSQQIYLFGEGIGLPRAVPYQGPETVLDLLQRISGLKPGAAAGDVYVIRPHITEGRPPEVFHIDLAAILLQQNLKTNLRLEPFDQVHVGQTRQAGLEKCVPPWLQPTYESLCGLRRPGENK
jgi:protein involved in polysaccharide export with SLBB domain